MRPYDAHEPEAHEPEATYNPSVAEQVAEALAFLFAFVVFWIAYGMFA